MHENQIYRVENGGRELLVAVSFGLAASEAVADRRSSSQIKRWEAYARLYKKVDLLFLLAPLLYFYRERFNIIKCIY